MKNSGTLIGIVFVCVDGKLKAILGRRIRIAQTRFVSLKSRAVIRSRPDRPTLLLIDSGPLIDVRADELIGKPSDISKSFELDDVLEEITPAAVYIYELQNTIRCF